MVDLRITVPILKVLRALLAADHLYGLDITEQTGVKGGTLYPVLARLERAEWVESEWEDVDPHDAGRPRRRYYQITERGRPAAAAALAEFRR